MKSKTKIIQVSNIAPQATKDQVSSLFSYIGKIDDIRLYPTVRDVAIPIHSRISFVKFQDRDCVPVAQHVMNTIFIDRALAVVPYQGNDMPDEKISMDILHSNGAIPGFATDAKWPTHVTNHVCIEGAIVRTDDPHLAENGLPDYPNLPATTESYKVNEMRRTVAIDNINPKATAEDLLALGESVGEVKYVKMGIEKDGTKNCLVEFSELHYLIPAMKLHDKDFMGQPLIVSHATAAVIKPLTKSNESAQAEIEEALNRVKDVQTSLFNSNMDPLAFLDVSVKEQFSLSRSRSRSRSRRTRSKSHSRSSKVRRRSRSRSRRRSRSRSRSRRHHSSRKRSRSKTKRSRRSRSRSKTDRRSQKEKDSKSKNVEGNMEPNIDAIAELIGKELQKEIDSSKKEVKSSRNEKEDKHSKIIKLRKSMSKSKSRERHRHRSRSRKRSRSKHRGRRSSSRSHSKRSRSRSRRRKRSRERRSPRGKRRSRSRSRKRSTKHDREKSKDISNDRKERKREKKSPEPKKIARNYDEEEEMYIEEKKETMESKKEEAIDMDISD